MGNTYTLENLKADLDREFAPLVIDLGDGEVTLQNVMRLNKSDREKVLELLDNNSAEDTSSVESLNRALDMVKQVVTIVTKDNKGKKVAAAIGDDLALGNRILSLWMEATQPGEVQNSPS